MIDGTAGDDTFNAPRVDDPLQTGVLVQTLGDGDVLDGKGGTNTLNATLVADAGTPILDSIQILNLTSRDNAAALNLTSADSVEQLWNIGSTRNLTVEAVQNEVILGLSGVREGTTYSVTYAGNVVGNDYTQALVLNGAGTAATAATLSITAGTGNTVKALDFVSVAGTNNLDLNAGLVSVESITLNGDGGSLKMAIVGANDNFTNLKTLDGTEYAGDVDMDIRNATNNKMSVELGDGDNTLTVGAVQFAAAKTDVVVDLGAGDNTLKVAFNKGGVVADQGDINALNFDAGTVSGVGTLELGNAGDDITVGVAGATLNLKGISPAEVVFGKGDTLTLNGNLTFSNEAETLTTTFAGGVTGAGTLIFSEVKDLSINVEEVAFTAGGVTGAKLTAVSIDAAENATLGNVTVANGTQAASNVLTLATDGSGEVTGTLVLTGGTSRLNKIELSNEGDGDRTFTLDGPADLKAAAGAGQAKGEGIVIDGDGSGKVKVAAAGSNLDNMTIDATGYEGGEVTVDIATAFDTGAGVRAAKFTGIDVLEVSGTGDTKVDKLGADVKVLTSGTVGTLTLVDTVAERTLELSDTTLGDYLDASTETLTIVTVGGAARTLTDLNGGDGEGTGLQTLNIAATGGNFTLTNLYETRDATLKFGSEFEVNLSGTGNVTLSGLTAGDGITKVTVNADATGTQTTGAFDVSNMVADGSLVLAGSQTLANVSDILVGTDVVDGFAISLENAKGVTISNIQGRVDAGDSLVVNSAGGDDNTINHDTNALVFGDGAEFVITGDQDLTIGIDALQVVEVVSAASKADVTVDASAFTGELTANLASLVNLGSNPSGADVNVTHTIKLGTGDADITLADGDTAGRENSAGANDTAANYVFVFSADGIGEVEITEFATAVGGSSNIHDVLDFSDVAGVNAIGDLTLTNVDTDNSGTLDSVKITSVHFEGSITLIDVLAAQVSAANNFDFG